MTKTSETVLDIRFGQPEREIVPARCGNCKTLQKVEIDPDSKRAQFYLCEHCGSTEKYYSLSNEKLDDSK